MPGFGHNSLTPFAPYGLTPSALGNIGGAEESASSNSEAVTTSRAALVRPLTMEQMKGEAPLTSDDMQSVRPFLPLLEKEYCSKDRKTWTCFGLHSLLEGTVLDAQRKKELLNHAFNFYCEKRASFERFYAAADAGEFVDLSEEEQNKLEEKSGVAHETTKMLANVIAESCLASSAMLSRVHTDFPYDTQEAILGNSSAPLPLREGVLRKPRMTRLALKKPNLPQSTDEKAMELFTGNYGEREIPPRDRILVFELRIEYALNPSLSGALSLRYLTYLKKDILSIQKTDEARQWVESLFERAQKAALAIQHDTDVRTLQRIAEESLKKISSANPEDEDTAPDRDLLSKIAMHGNVPDDIATRLYDTGLDQFIASLARNRAAPEKLLREIFARIENSDQLAHIEIAGILCSNPSLPKDLFTPCLKQFTSSRPIVIPEVLFAQNSELPPTLVQKEATIQIRSTLVSLILKSRPELLGTEDIDLMLACFPDALKNAGELDKCAGAVAGLSNHAACDPKKSAHIKNRIDQIQSSGVHIAYDELFEKNDGLQKACGYALLAALHPPRVSSRANDLMKQLQVQREAQPMSISDIEFTAHF